MGFADRLRASMPARADFPGRVGFAAWELDEREPVVLGAEQIFHAASTIKVLVLLAALREVGSGRLRLGARLAVPAARAGGSGVLHELRGVHRMELADLLTLMIVISDNAATNVVIDEAGLEAIEECARALGCTGTHLERRLMDERAEGRIATTAADQARMLDALVRGRVLPEELTRYAMGVLSRQQVRDRLPARLPGGVRCWNKTGELLGVRHDVGVIGSGRGSAAVVAVLVDGLADERSLRDYRGGPACEFIADLGLAVHRALG